MYSAIGFYVPYSACILDFAALKTDIYQLALYMSVFNNFQHIKVFIFNFVFVTEFIKQSVTP